MHKKIAFLGLATLALSVTNAPQARAALINGVTVSTDMGESFSNSINKMVDGSGLSSLSLDATHAPASALSNAWFSSGTTTGNITFNLNGLYSLAGFSLWNFNGFNQTGIKDVTITTSTNGTNFTTFAGTPTQFAIGANNAAESPEKFSFAPVSAAFVRFQVLNNYGSNVTGLSEVQFNDTAATAVPEPFAVIGTLVGGTAALRLRKRLQAKQKV